MAWLSIGTSNEDLCLKLQGHQILKSGRILQAFQATDRGDFVFPDDRYVPNILMNKKFKEFN